MDKSGQFDPEQTLDAIWCRDNETGKRVLVDRKTGQVITPSETQDAK